MTGAGGFLGAHLLARFVGAGMSVTLVGPDTGESRYTASMVAAGDVRFVRCDATYDDPDLTRTLEAADALVLCGLGEFGWSSGLTRGIAEIDGGVMRIARVIGTFARRGKHVVLASSDSVYGAPPRTPVRESDATWPRTEAGLIALACEQAVRVCAEKEATATVLRYSTMYGPGEGATREVPSLIRAALAGHAPIFDDDAIDERDYLHVADAVDAAISALRRRADGIYNVGTGIGTTLAELASLVVWLTGCPEAPIRRASPEHAVRGSVVLDASRARQALGFEARHALADGLKEEVGWIRAAFGSDLKTAA
jgi:UDP-glucose 4-epimerase